MAENNLTGSTKHRNNARNNAMQTESPKTATKGKLQPVGFDCEFIERPKELQTECPICLMVLRNPHQVTCCGYAYCRSCIELVQFNRKACPTCNNSCFTIFPDKSLHKSLYAFKVWCSKKREGCHWTGELGKLASHLNDNPTQDFRLEGCEFVLISCFHCSELCIREMLKKHEESECIQRSYTCPMCDNFHSTFIDVTEKHLPQCLLQRVPCPNKCGEILERGKLDSHLNRECSKRECEQVPCEFSFAGCMELSVPEKVQQHLDQNISTHLSLLAGTYSIMRERLIEMQGQLDDNNAYIEKLSKEKKEMQENFQVELEKIRAIRYELDEVKMMQRRDRDAIEVLESNSSLLPVTITLGGYEKRQSEGDMGWTSIPFYTHQHGYRMCLWVDIGGSGAGKGIYVSVFVSLLKGDYDSNLVWPFRGSLLVQVLNQMDQKLHHDEVIKYIESTPKESAGRIMEEGKKAKPWGRVKFIRHDELKDAGFIMNDAIKFHIKNECQN